MSSSQGKSGNAGNGNTGSSGGGKKDGMLKTFMTSGMSVACATGVTHPIDVVKVHQQLQNMGKRAGSKSMVATTRDLLSEGGFKALYRGYGPGVARAASFGCLRLGLYEPCRDALIMVTPGTGGNSNSNSSGGGEQKKISVFHKVAGGLVSGSIATAATNPLDVAKVRMQLRPESVVGTDPALQRSRGMVSEMVRIAKAEGPGALMKGVAPAMGRAAALTASQVAVYDECKQALKVNVGLRDGFPLHLASSMLAGVATTAATSPFDTVKTRMMAAGSKNNYATAAAASTAAPSPAVAGRPAATVAPQPAAPLPSFAASPAFNPLNLRPAMSTQSASSLSPQLATSAATSATARQGASAATSQIAARLPQASAVASGLRAVASLQINPSAAASAAAASAPSAATYPVYRSSLQCAYVILRTEGLLGLYKGWAATYARQAPQTCIIFVVYEQLRWLAGMSSIGEKK